MYCSNCGKELKYKSIFCEECGAKIDYEAMEKIEKDAARRKEAGLDDGPFGVLYAQKRRRKTIAIGIFNIVVFGLFFTKWFGAKFFDLFEGFGFSFFDLYSFFTSFSDLYSVTGNSFLRIFKDVPFYVILLGVSVGIFYLISGCKLFAATVRIFANKTKVKLEKQALIFSLVTALCAYMFVLVIQIALNDAFGGYDVGSSIISVTGWLVIFVITIVIMLISTCRVMHDCVDDFTPKGKKTFSVWCKIYDVCLILGFLIGIGVIKLPSFNLTDKLFADKEPKMEYSTLYEAAEDMEGYQYDDSYYYGYSYDDNSYDYYDDEAYYEHIKEDPFYDQFRVPIEDYYNPSWGDIFESDDDTPESSVQNTQSEAEIYDELVELEASFQGMSYDIKGYKDALRNDYYDLYTGDYLEVDGTLFDYIGDNSEFFIPGSVSEIYHFAFTNLYDLHKVSFYGDSLYLYGYAFWNCPLLKEVDIPKDSDVNIQKYHFFGTWFSDNYFYVNESYKLKEDCSEYVDDSAAMENRFHRLYPSSVSASSVLPDEGEFNYSPENLFDNDITTAYVEGVKGLGIGETVSVDLGSDYYISKIIISPGYNSNENVFNKNSTPTRITVTFKDEYEEDRTETFYIDYPYYRTETGMTFDSVLASSIEFTIEDALKGMTYEDTCISEIYIMGVNANE